MAITSLTITYTGNEIWTLTDNEGNVRSEAFYSGAIYNDYLFIKSKTGGNVYAMVPYTIVSYIDEIEPANSFTPANATELLTKLKQFGFFDVTGGGGGGVDRLLELLDVDTPNYLGKQGWFLVVNDDQTTVSFKPMTGIDQDNVATVSYFNFLKNDTNQDILDKINAIPFNVVGETQIRLFVGTELQSTGALTSPTGRVLKYLLKNTGKGYYGTGLGATPLTLNNLELIFDGGLTIQDIEDDPDTVIINFDEIEEPVTVSQWLNEQSVAFDIQPQDEGYTLFKGTVDGVETSYLWIGTAGLYGVGEEQSTMVDFERISDEPPVPGVQTVTGDLVDNTQAFNPKVYEKKDLPRDFFISCWQEIDGSGFFGKKLMYLTDEYRELDLYEVFPDIFPTLHEAYNNTSIHRNDLNPNEIFICGQFDSSTGSRFVAKMDCRIVNNVLVATGKGVQDITGILASSSGGVPSFHGSYVKDGYLYFSTRPNSGVSTISTQIIKVNCADVTDYDVYTLPNTVGYYSLATKIEVFEDWIYMLMTETVISNAGKGYMIRIHTSLKYHEIVFTIDNTTDKLLRLATYWLIHNNEIIVPTVNNVSQPDQGNTLGIQVYTMNGVLKRDVSGLVVNDTAQGQPATHWMGIKDNKAILVISSSVSTNPRNLVRIDVGFGVDGEADYVAPVVEEWVKLNAQITNDNSLFENGDVYLNSEGALGTGLHKFYYKDFTIYSNEIDGFLSNGSIIPTQKQDSLLTSTAQLVNKGDGISLYATEDHVANAIAAIPAPTKTTVGLGNVDNTSDADKLVSTAQQAALDLKIDKTKAIQIIHSDTVDSSSLTGTTTETILKTYTINPNETSIGRLMMVTEFDKVGTAGTVTVKVYRNSVNNLTGSPVQIGVAIIGATNLYYEFKRTFRIKADGKIYGYPFVAGSANGEASALNQYSTNWNDAGTEYIIWTATLTSSADAVKITGFELNFRKQ